MSRRDEQPAPESDRAQPVRVAIGTALTALGAWASHYGGDWTMFLSTIGSVVAPTVTVRYVWNRTRAGRGLWDRMMAGRFGRALFRLAGLGLGRLAGAMPFAGEPTAIAIGRAAHELFDELPAEQRQRFAQLPDLVARLERAAIALRAKTPDPERHARFTSAVAALENVRLNLLQLHAGRGSLDELTRELVAAERIHDDIAAQLQGQAEVDRIIGELKTD